MIMMMMIMIMCINDIIINNDSIEWKWCSIERIM